MEIQVSDGRISTECSAIGGKGECFGGEGERKDLVKVQMFLALVVVPFTNIEHMKLE